MINTTMEILALIELISLSNSGLDTFYFEMKDTNAMQTAYVYPSVKIQSHFT